MELIQSKTYENLKKAYIAECSARTRYEFVEYGQRMAGYEGLAKITDKIAYQEFNHARMLYTYIEDASKGTIDNLEIKVSLPFRQKWDLVENLRLTAVDEEDEAKFYQKAEKTAISEGFSEIAALFNMIRKVEIKHKKIFNYLYEKMKNKKLFNSDKEKEWICPSCGHSIKATVAPEKCPLCMAKRETFLVSLPKELNNC
ncbi:MAG: rubrerythrin family protein [Clostridiales bacterium]|nr:rubrerythrin family protein [Clostridiales bacterium]